MKLAVVFHLLWCLYTVFPHVKHLCTVSVAHVSSCIAVLVQ